MILNHAKILKYLLLGVLWIKEVKRNVWILKFMINQCLEFNVLLLGIKIRVGKLGK